MKTQAELEAMVRRACGHEHHRLSLRRWCGGRADTSITLWIAFAKTC
jgi:hypothetical protein